ncbi:prohibitin family protein [Bacteroidia bacterium]|nr:prohibitin family protein [Bacteroidia bacterium]
MSAILFIGILILIFSFIQINVPNWEGANKTIRIVGIGAIVLGLVIGCFIQINAGFVGVQTLFGKVKGQTLESGLHIINPMVKVQQMDTRTQNYTMSGIHNEGEKSGDDAIRILSKDGLEVTIDLTVLYRILPTESPNVYKNTGMDYTMKVVRPLARTKIRDHAVAYDAVSLYSSKREEFQQRIVSSIEKEFKNRGLILEQVLIRNISLPASVKASIESKINAEQESQKMEFVLTKEKQEADRKRVEAQGISDYQRIISASLTKQQLQYEAIKAQLELAKSANAKVIVMGKGNSPIILGAK